MNRRIFIKNLTSFQVIILGFLGLILAGSLLLMLPIAAKSGQFTMPEEALFTATSAVCVTGLVVRDTATYWSAFGQAVILVLIQLGGLGIIFLAALVITLSGRRLSIRERSILQDTISAHQVGGILKMTVFFFKAALITELLGALIMLPSFCTRYGMEGVWLSVFHSVSAFCNAGFDLMGDKTGPYSSLTSFGSECGIVIPICSLIIIGGIGFLTWDDIAVNRLTIKKYRLQSKVILVSTAFLIMVPMLYLFLYEYPGYALKERICLSLFQSVTPRTAGFNTSDLTALSGAGRMLLIVLMLIGGSPGSTAGGMKTTTITVLMANTLAVFRKRKSVQILSRRVDDGTIRTASTLLLMYAFLALSGSFIISITDNLPIGTCLFESASAIGTVGLSLGITPALSTVSHMVLILLMFIGRVGGLTLVYAAVTGRKTEVSLCPVEKIIIG